MLADRDTVIAAGIVLASGSPRRVEILNGILNLGARVVPSTFPEDLDKSLYTPEEYVKENARRKAMEVYSRLQEQGTPAGMVVGADTVVIGPGETILEKPKTADAAKEMLASLSGGEHRVATGVALIYSSSGGTGGDDEAPHIDCFVEATRVTFASLSQEVIANYVATGEPMDKAGGYGIQGLGGSFVSGIVGCYHNVVGFPMHAFCKHVDCARLAAWVRARDVDGK